MKAKDAIGLALMALALSLVGGGFYLAHEVKRAKIDAQTLCPLAGVSEATSIIIDKTDPLTPQERAKIRDTVLQERDALRPGAQISVLVLQEHVHEKAVSARAVLTLCHPGQEANPLFENPKRVQEFYARAFDAPLQDTLDGVLEGGSAPSSPIAATLVQALDDATVRRVTAPRIVLISDLMEHTDKGSAYDGSFSQATLERILDAYHRMRLQNAVVELVVLPRPKLAAKQAQAKAVWTQFLQRSHAAPQAMNGPRQAFRP